ncbi:nocturnin isoform X1 [Homalodisca vitripennis]|uniref:nocturnin isoform X1 n=1 Tax=Homalodisca vitripennis TaxID=197043 RepID=UPI001EEB5BED|nr:nocturnin isoform X1 [Homalodisca vitripennis]
MNSRHLRKVPSRLLKTAVRPRPVEPPVPEFRPPTPRMVLETPRFPYGIPEEMLYAIYSPKPPPLCPMGSFNSAPKILNEDTQDDDVTLPARMSQDQLLTHCRQQMSPPSLISRHFRHLQTDCSESKPSTLRILQWNLLSQALGQNNDNFVSCPEAALEWSRRRNLIADEIVRYSPDIICLQEVDHFKYLQKVLGTQGFRGMFFPKPDSPCMYIKGNNGPDGCAIFYQTERYQLVRTETRVLEVWRVQSNQVAILMILRDKETDEEICVATTHLKARNGALLSALRNEQGKDLLEFVAQHAGNRPVILSGDFNAEPIEPIYSTVLSHDLLRLTSAYGQGAEPPYTTWKIREEGEVCHTIDYVFCSRDRFTTTNLLEFPSGEEIGIDRIPSFSYPSDHFSLVCDLDLHPAKL